MVASGGGAASGLAVAPESDPAPIGVLALPGVDPSADSMGDRLLAAPLDDPPLVPVAEPDEPDELVEPLTGALEDAPELLDPVSPCEPAGGEADSLLFGESLPHAAMKIAAPKHEISLPETRTVKYSC
jgi:hypothetical protein